MKKTTFFRLVLLFAVLAFAQIWAQQPGKKQRPKVGEPHTVGCKTKEERCKKCKLYELELQLMADKLSETDYHAQRTAEDFWLNANCKGSDTIPPIPSDPCWGKRNFYLTQNRLTGEQVFKVCRNQVVNGECRATNDCVEVLRFQAGKDIGNRYANFLVNFIPAASQPSSGSHLPFALPNNHQADWAKASSVPERPANPFFIFLPDGKSDTVWMLKSRSPGSQEAEAVVLPQFKASWFNLGGVKDERIGTVAAFLNRVSAVLANDPASTLVRHSPANDTTQLFVTLHGKAKGSHFLVSTGFSTQGFLGEYEPIRHENGAEISSLIIPSLARGEQLDNRLVSMIDAWKNRQANYQVVAAAPFGSWDTPFRAIGSPVGQSCEEVLRRQLRGGSIDLLVKSNNDYSVWRHGAAEREKVEWFDDIVEHFKPNCFLRLLAIADPKLKVLAASHDVQSGLNKLVFIYSKNPGVVYAWSWKDDQAPSEKTPLRDEQRFELTGEPVAPYIASLRVSVNPGERDFLLRLADQPNLHLLDLFFNTSPGERILLYANDLPRSDARRMLIEVKAHRLAASGAMPDILLRALDVNSQRWTDFQARYMANGGWQRKVFIEKLAKTTVKSPEAWLNVERMGVVLGLSNGDARLSIHLPEPRRSPFGPADFSRIRKTIQDDGLIYIAGGAPSRPDELLQSCLRQTWDRQVWRANPLGYFDRCKTL